MTIIPYDRHAMKLANMDAMPRGLNCRYLECTRHHSDPAIFVAAQYRCQPPNRPLFPDSVLIDFRPEKPVKVSA